MKLKFLSGVIQQLSKHLPGKKKNLNNSRNNLKEQNKGKRFICILYSGLTFLLLGILTPPADLSADQTLGKHFNVPHLTAKKKKKDSKINKDEYDNDAVEFVKLTRRKERNGGIKCSHLFSKIKLFILSKISLF